MDTYRTLFAALALVSGLSACTYWHREDGLLTEPLGQRDRVQIWIGTTAHDVHGVVVRGDSLTAVPFWRPPTCDSCRVTLARADVDSVRAVEVPGETIFFAGAVIVGFIILHVRQGFASNYQ